MIEYDDADRAGVFLPAGAIERCYVLGATYDASSGMRLGRRLRGYGFQCPTQAGDTSVDLVFRNRKR